LVLLLVVVVAVTPNVSEPSFSFIGSIAAAAVPAAAVLTKKTALSANGRLPPSLTVMVWPPCP
jgi:hypothetical protein